MRAAMDTLEQICVGYFPFDPPHLVFTLFPHPPPCAPKGHQWAPSSSGFWLGWPLEGTGKKWGAGKIVQSEYFFLLFPHRWLTVVGWHRPSPTSTLLGPRTTLPFTPLDLGALRAPAPHCSYLSLLNENRDLTLLPVFPQHLKLSRTK